MECVPADATELPSSVTDREYIFLPLDIVKDDPGIYGKWMLFSNGDLNYQDYLWIQLQALLLNKDILRIESSTAKKCPKRGEFQGVIKCYTCEDRDVIKRAGIAIQGIMKKDVILNYKTNKASKYILYRAFGNRFITKYMLTFSGKFYEQDKLDRWIQSTDIPVENSLQGNSTLCYISGIYTAPEKRKQMIDSELLPSHDTSKKRYSYPTHASLNNFSGVWCLFCNAVDPVEDGSDITELDYIWRESKVLRDEGLFTSVYCETYALQPHFGENAQRRTVFCELEDYSDIDRVIQSGDKLRQKTSYNYPMYFKTVYLSSQGKAKYLLKYLYTDDRDLYEYVDECWILKKRH